MKLQIAFFVGTLFGTLISVATIHYELQPSRDTCSEFWGEQCTLTYVPNSVSDTFSQKTYDEFRAGQAELAKERNAEATKAQEENVK